MNNLNCCQDFSYFSLYLAGNSRGLEKSGRPGPLRHDGGGRQPDGDLAARVKGRVEIVSIVVDIFTNLNKSP